MSLPDDPGDALPAAEVARIRARDRKRTTRMVVDNAGLKKVVLAQRDRAQARRSAQRAVPDAEVAEGGPRPG
jgi:hypothetical protein